VDNAVRTVFTLDVFSRWQAEGVPLRSRVLHLHTAHRTHDDEDDDEDACVAAGAGADDDDGACATAGDEAVSEADDDDSACATAGDEAVSEADDDDSDGDSAAPATAGDGAAAASAAAAGDDAAAAASAGDDAAAAGAAPPGSDTYIEKIRSFGEKASKRVKNTSAEWGMWVVAPHGDIWQLAVCVRKPSGAVTCLAPECSRDTAAELAGVPQCRRGARSYACSAHAKPLDRCLAAGSSTRRAPPTHTRVHLDMPPPVLGPPPQSTILRDPFLRGQEHFGSSPTVKSSFAPAAGGISLTFPKQLKPATSCKMCHDFAAACVADTSTPCDCPCGCRHKCPRGHAWADANASSWWPCTLVTHAECVEVEMCSLECAHCDAQLQYDGLGDRLFALNKSFVFEEEHIRHVLRHWGRGLSSFTAAARMWCRKPHPAVNRKLINAALSAYVSYVCPIPTPVSCPACGGDPSVTVWDGTSVGVLRRLIAWIAVLDRMHDGIEHHGLDLAEYCFIAGPGTAAAHAKLLEFTSKKAPTSVSRRWFDEMLQAMRTVEEPLAESSPSAHKAAPVTQGLRMLSLDIFINAAVRITSVGVECDRAVREFLRTIVCEGVGTAVAPYPLQKRDILRQLMDESTGAVLSSAVREQMRRYMPLLHNMADALGPKRWQALYPSFRPLLRELLVMNHVAIKKMALLPASYRAGKTTHGGTHDKLRVSDGTDLHCYATFTDDLRYCARATHAFSVDANVASPDGAGGSCTKPTAGAAAGTGDSDSCCKKKAPASNDRWPGVFTGMCAHGFWCGHVLMSRHESPKILFDIIRERMRPDKERVIFYDNACHLAVYVARRCPSMLAWCRFMLDRLHVTNHNTCNPEFDSKYWEHEETIKKANSQAAEQSNSQLQSVATSVQSMAPLKAVQFLRLHYAVCNNDKLEQLEKTLGASVVAAAMAKHAAAGAAAAAVEGASGGAAAAPAVAGGAVAATDAASAAGASAGAASAVGAAAGAAWMPRYPRSATAPAAIAGRYGGSETAFVNKSAADIHVDGLDAVLVMNPVARWHTYPALFPALHIAERLKSNLSGKSTLRPSAASAGRPAKKAAVASGAAAAAAPVRRSRAAGAASGGRRATDDDDEEEEAEEDGCDSDDDDDTMARFAVVPAHAVHRYGTRGNARALAAASAAGGAATTA